MQQKELDYLSRFRDICSRYRGPLYLFDFSICFKDSRLETTNTPRLYY